MSLTKIPSGMVVHTADGTGAVATTVQAALRGEDSSIPDKRGFWTTDVSGVNIHRFRDRLFVGESVKHKGSSVAPYGLTWLSTNVATWPEKNAQVSMLSSEEKIGILGGVQATDASGASSIGIASFSYNTRTAGTARAMYADVTHANATGSSYGLEIAINNIGADKAANSYSLNGGAIGIHMTPEGGTGYTIGDSDVAATEATAPATCGINIGTGSGGTANKKWNLGIRFASNGLTVDGSGNSVAMSMGQKQAIEWMASSTIYGARIRSDVTAVSGQDVGLLFENNSVSIKGTAMSATIADFVPVASGVNNVRITNSATGSFPIVASVGSDTNIGMFFNAKGASNFRFRTNAGSNEQFRISDTASSVNFLGVSGAVTGSGARMDALGADTNINVVIAPKGTGDTILPNGSLKLSTAGEGLYVKEGSNAKQGASVLVGGTVTVSNTSVTANSRILLTSNVDGGTPGFLRVSARTVGADFTITSSSGTDTSTVAWQIFEPA